MKTMTELLRINNLIVSFRNPEGKLTAVKGVSLKLDAGETLALVGESGCGKTVLCKSMLKILCDKGRIEEGEIFLDGENLLSLNEREITEYRGNDIAMVFQDPMTSLDPGFSVGGQIAEVLILHKKMNKKEAASRAVELMKLVGIEEAEKRYSQRPYQFSGGMRQRIAIAIALAAEPRLLLADEPTTALDEKTRDEIIRLIKKLKDELRIGVLFITHDLSIVEDIADRVAIMKDGKLIEEGSVRQVFEEPNHEYTRKLLGYLDYKKGKGHNHREDGLIPDMEDEEKMEEETLIDVKDLNVKYELGKNHINHVLKDFNMRLYRGEIVGIVGQSGCGKSTLARCIMALEKYEGEIVRLQGINVQMIFQDTGAVFNDRMNVEEIVIEPLTIKEKRLIKNSEQKNRHHRLAVEAMKAVELDEAFLKRKHYELSGGQRQRVAIARALITKPDVIIADEPLTGLDVTAQAQIVHLFKKISKENKVAILFIAHDLPMVNHVSRRIINM